MSIIATALPRKRLTSSDDYLIVRLLSFGALEPRAGGGFRFGTKIIQAIVVERIIAAGRARMVDGRVVGISRP